MEKLIVELEIEKGKTLCEEYPFLYIECPNIDCEKYNLSTMRILKKKENQ